MIHFKDIQIPKPCSVDFDSLPGDEVKRFCGSCEKHVYDFRGKDEAYLNEVYQTTGKVCGIYYEDQIQKTSLKIQQPFYYSFVAKLIGVGLFLKTLLSSYDTEAKISNTFPTTQVSEDSVKVKFKNRPSSSSYYNISIYINGVLYKSQANADGGFIYLPDIFEKTDQIKVIVRATSHNRFKRISYIVKQKEYNFTLSESDKITIVVDYDKKITLIKRRHVAGVPGDFW